MRVERPRHPFVLVAGADTAFSSDGKWAFAGVIVCRLPHLEEVERASAIFRVSFPYVPGLLTFREGPALSEAFRRLRNEPDCVLFDGHGLAHPRRMGIATHMSLILSRPTIGCAKSCLCGEYEGPSHEVGAWTPLVHKGETVGAVLRTRAGVRPVFVSPGGGVDLDTSIRTVMGLLRSRRLPEPTRLADRFAAQLKNSWQGAGSGMREAGCVP